MTVPFRAMGLVLGLLCFGCAFGQEAVPWRQYGWGEVASSVYAPDGRHILSVSKSGAFWLTDAATGETVRNGLPLGAVRLQGAQYFPDGKHIVVSGPRAWVLDADTWAVQYVLGPTPEFYTQYVEDAVPSPDGQQVLVAEYTDTVGLYDAATGDRLRQFPVVSPRLVRFAAGGTRVVAFSNTHTIELFDTATGASVALLTEDWFGGGGGAVSPDGSVIAASTGDDLRLWDGTTGVERAHWPHLASWDMTFSPDGSQLLATDAWGVVQLIEVATAEVKLERDYDRGFWLACRFSPDGKTVVSSFEAEVWTWALAADSEMRYISSGHTEFLRQWAMSLDGRRVVTVSDTGVYVWDADTGRERLRIPAMRPRAAALSADGAEAYIVGGVTNYDYQLTRWSVDEERELADPVNVPGDLYDPAHFSTDGRLLAITDNGYYTAGTVVCLIDTETGGTLQTFVYESNCKGGPSCGPPELRWVMLSADNTRMATDLGIRDVATGEEIVGLPYRTNVLSPDFARWGRIFDDVLSVGDVATGETRLEFSMLPREAWGPGFSPDGVHAAFIHEFGDIVVWDLDQNLELMRTPTYRRGWLTTIQYTPDGRMVGLSDFEDTALRLWKLPPVAVGPENAHSADRDADGLLSTAELLRVIQLYKADVCHCSETTEDGFAPGPGENQDCPRHDSDYADPAWQVGLRELLRAVQIHNSPGGYRYCPDAATPDGFCVD